MYNCVCVCTEDMLCVESIHSCERRESELGRLHLMCYFSVKRQLVAWSSVVEGEPEETQEVIIKYIQR